LDIIPMHAQTWWCRSGRLWQSSQHRGSSSGSGI
jgi:hypothetical protein